MIAAILAIAAFIFFVIYNIVQSQKRKRFSNAFIIQAKYSEIKEPKEASLMLIKDLVERTNTPSEFIDLIYNRIDKRGHSLSAKNTWLSVAEISYEIIGNEESYTTEGHLTAKGEKLVAIIEYALGYLEYAGHISEESIKHAKKKISEIVQDRTSR